MNVWLTLALALLAFFFIQENQVFFAFLCIIAIVFALATEKPKPQMAVARGPHGERYAVQSKGGKIPSKMRLRVQKDWGARSMWEEFGSNMIGPVLETVGSTIFRLVSGGHSERETDQEEAPRGR